MTPLPFRAKAQRKCFCLVIQLQIHVVIHVKHVSNLPNKKSAPWSRLLFIFFIIFFPFLLFSKKEGCRTYIPWPTVTYCIGITGSCSQGLWLHCCTCQMFHLEESKCPSLDFNISNIHTWKKKNLSQINHNWHVVTMETSRSPSVRVTARRRRRFFSELTSRDRLTIC